MQEQAKELPKKKAAIFHFVEFGRLRRVLIKQGNEKFRNLQFEIVNRDFEYLSQISALVSGFLGLLAFRAIFKRTRHAKSSLINYLNKFYLLPILSGAGTLIISMQMCAMLVGQRMADGLKYVINDPIYAKWLHPEKKFASNNYDAAFTYRPISKKWLFTSNEPQHMKEALIAFEEQINKSVTEPENDLNETEMALTEEQPQADTAIAQVQNETSQIKNDSDQKSKWTSTFNDSGRTINEGRQGFDIEENDKRLSDDKERSPSSEFTDTRTENLRNRFLA